VFCIYLRTSSDLCHLQHKLIGFYNRDENCLQRGTDWVFKYNSLRFVFIGLKCWCMMHGTSMRIKRWVLFGLCSKMSVRSELFWDFTQRRTIVSDVSGHFGPSFKGQALQVFIFLRCANLRRVRFSSTPRRKRDIRPRMCGEVAAWYHARYVRGTYSVISRPVCAGEFTAWYHARYVRGNYSGISRPVCAGVLTAG
jgi:hypothetical protein